MLSLMAALAALLCLLLAVAGLFKPALLGQTRRLNAFFIGIYGSLGFLMLGMGLDGKFELSGWLVLLALLAAAHSILLLISHAHALKLKMSKDERANVRPGKAVAGVVLLFLAAGAGAWLTSPAPLDAPIPPAESAKVQSEQLPAEQPAKALRALSLAEQCQLEQDIYQQMNQVTDGVMARFGGLLDGKQIDYHQIAEYRVSTVNPAIDAARSSVNEFRTSHMDDDVVIRQAADLVFRTNSFVGQLYTFSRNGDASALKTARDQLVHAVASHKQARAVCGHVGS